MNYCTNCGNKIDSNDFVCPTCGVRLKNEPINYSNNSIDNGGFGWGLLGFFVPVVGLILFLIWKNEKPKTSKACGIGAFVYLIFYIVIIIVSFVFSFYGVINGDINEYNDDYYYEFE